MVHGAMMRRCWRYGRWVVQRRGAAGHEVTGSCSDKEDHAIIVRWSDMEGDDGLSSARRWRKIVDRSGGAKVRCRKVIKIVVRGSLMSQGVV